MGKSRDKEEEKSKAVLSVFWGYVRNVQGTLGPSLSLFSSPWLFPHWLLLSKQTQLRCCLASVASLTAQWNLPPAPSSL